MIPTKAHEQERLRRLFAHMSVEPVVSYTAIIDAVRRTAPPENVWGLARDIATHLALEPASVFFPDQTRTIRRGMADRWVHGALGFGEGRSKREMAVVAAWETMQFAGIPPLRIEPLRYFVRRYEEREMSVFPLAVDHDAKAIAIS